MRLDQELVKRGLCESRTEAQELIEKGAVLVNNSVCTKQAKEVLDIDTLSVTAHRRFVSRGGEKLEGALAHIGLEVAGMSVLDVGSSTGGFTDCLLQHGASKVVAVDVGTEQFHTMLRSDTRVTLHENTDIRNFATMEKFDLIVGDVSFISLRIIVPTLLSLSQAGTRVLFLIKPQFEVGKGGTKKGVVRDESLYDEVLVQVKNAFTEHDFAVLDVFPSSILGGEGNREFFIYARK